MKIISTCFFALMLAIVSCHNPEPETYLIPKGFTGKVNVIFNRKDGAPIKYENGRRVYEIPANGILLTQFKDEYGLADHIYFYVDSNDRRTPLEIFMYDNNKDGTVKWLVKDSNKVGIFSDGTTGKYGNNDNTKSVKYQEFVVSSFAGLKLLEPNDRFESRVKKIVGFDN